MNDHLRFWGSLKIHTYMKNGKRRRGSPGSIRGRAGCCNGNASDFHSGGAQLESLSWQNFYGFPQFPPCKCRDRLSIRPRPLLIKSFPAMVVRVCTIRDTGTIVKYNTKKKIRKTGFERHQTDRKNTGGNPRSFANTKTHGGTSLLGAPYSV
jgi:hypothetical protein